MTDWNTLESLTWLDDIRCQVRLDSKVYRLTATKKALYKFADHLSVDIALESEATILLSIEFSANSRDENNKLLKRLRNELIDQELREIIFEQTEATRTLILAEAFSKTSLLQN